MDRIRIGLVGCGGMGTRHLYGLRELNHSPFCNVELAAVCDLNAENAQAAALEAEKLFGVMPPVFADMEEMTRQVTDIDAVDVVVDPCFHEKVVVQALDLGLHVQVEKPMAITVKGCLNMIFAARRNDRKLSIAENFRRDPSARLVNHLIRSGVVGTPYMALFHSQGAGSDIFITPWRHLKERGGLILDLGVHFTDLIRYQLGEISEVYGEVRLVDAVRHKPPQREQQYEFYRRRAQEMAEQVPATAEDSSLAQFRMCSGASVSWMVGMGGHGRSSRELILAEGGSIEGFGTRGGGVCMQDANRRDLTHEEMVKAEEGFELEPLAAYFFPDRIAAGDSAVDWKLLALEYFELGEAILHGRQIEVDGVEGLKDVAAVYAIFESARAGRPVTMEEVESGCLYEYQQEIEDNISATV